MEGASRCALGSQAQHTKQLHNIQQQNNKHTLIYCEVFHQTIHKHSQTCNTQNIQGYNITRNTTQVLEAIKQSKNNNSQGPDKLNIRHLKHIVPIPKPNKDTDKGTSYRPINLLSVIAKTLEKSPLHYITTSTPNTPMQHEYKTRHYTHKITP